MNPDTSIAAAPPGASIPARGGERVRLPALDGLRGLAILLVLAVHYYAIPPTSEGAVVHDFLRRLCCLGFSGVDLFFVLSGFLIGGILLDHRGSPRLIPAFYARRFFRIVPLYLLLLATFFIGREIPGLNGVNRGTYFASRVPDWSYFAFLQNFQMASLRDIGPYWLGMTWSLAIEEQFYLLVPFFILRLSVRQLFWLCGATILVTPVLRSTALHWAQNDLAAVFLLPARADGLMWGVLCACLVRTPAAVEHLRHARTGLRGVMLVLSALFLWASLLNLGAGSAPVIDYGYSLLNVLFATAVLYVVVFPAGRLASTLTLRPLGWIGITSYFIYLFHLPIWYLLHWLCFGRPPLHFTAAPLAVTGLALGVTFLAAWASWRWLEAPLLRLGRRYSY